MSKKNTCLLRAVLNLSWLLTWCSVLLINNGTLYRDIPGACMDWKPAAAQCSTSFKPQGVLYLLRGLAGTVVLTTTPQTDMHVYTNCIQHAQKECAIYIYIYIACISSIRCKYLRVCWRKSISRSLHSIASVQYIYVGARVKSEIYNHSHTH